jgi:hypothetical protein
VKLCAPIVAAALLSGCATTGEPPTREWLVGSWLMMAEGVEFPRLCDTGLPIHYLDDGTWRVFEGDGTWRLDGDRLRQTTIDTVADEIPPPSTSRIVRTGPDQFRRIGSNGEVATFRRCPPEP